MRLTIRLNAPYPGVTDWKSMFDIILTNCNKPHWFKGERPLRMLDVATGQIKWSPAQEFKRGSVYVEGSLDVSSQYRVFRGRSPSIYRN